MARWDERIADVRHNRVRAELTAVTRPIKKGIEVLAETADGDHVARAMTGAFSIEKSSEQIPAPQDCKQIDG